MNEREESYLIVGATGNLGRRIVEALLADVPGENIKAGARDGLNGKHAATLEGWQTQGVRVADINLDDEDSLTHACERVGTVISVVQGDRDVIVEGQGRLLNACLKTGVQRLVPSDYSLNFFTTDKDINPMLDWRREFDQMVQASGVPYTFFLNGGFMEAVFAPDSSLVNTKSGTVEFWGDGEARMDFTTMDDVAAYLVAAVRDPDTLNRTVEVAGAQRRPREIAEDYEAATGKRLELVSHGSLAEGVAQLERKKQEGAPFEELVSWMYLLPMLSGQGKLRHVENERYPQIHPTSLSEFFRLERAHT